MRVIRLVILPVILLGLGPAATRAQTDPAAMETDSTLAKWQWFQEVHGTEKTKSLYYSVSVPPEVFGKAKPDLSDVRLADAAGTRIPYAKRDLRPQYQRVDLTVLRRFDEGDNEEKRFAQVSLELADPGPPGHNDIEVDTPGMDFRRRAQVLAADNPQLKNAVVIADKFLVRYDVAGKVVNIPKVTYGFQRARFLQVRVYADPQADKNIPKIGAITVRRVIAIAGTFWPWSPATLGYPQPIRADGAPGTAWFISFQGDKADSGDPLPWDQLRFRVSGEEVERPFRLEIANPDEPRQTIQGIEWRWRKENDNRYLEATIPNEVFARRLRLVITDFANPPLSLHSVEFRYPVRQIIFSLPSDKAYQRPIRLYYGNPEANPPNYDFAQRLPAVLKPPPDAVTLGERSRNPAYQPPPRSWHERMPWLIYLVLGMACLILLGLLGLLARTALVRHDAMEVAKAGG